MKTYDFSRISEIEFEQLVNDLIQYDRLENKILVENFKAGRDQGIDGRYTDKAGKVVIIQSKHYIKTDIVGLLNVLKEKTDKNGKIVGEVVKVKKLSKDKKLDKYIFATSLSLSPQNKSDIFEIFHGFIESESDILGYDDISAMLSRCPEIEKKFINLYIHTGNFLEEVPSKVVHNAIFQRSKEYLLQIADKSKFFYVTPDFDKAIDILQKNSVIIIIGDPGIGKSTLCEQICLQLCSHSDEKIQFNYIQNSIREAEDVWNENVNQLFYFDDFLGSNYLEKVDGQDSDVMNFINRIQNFNKNIKKSKKFFILNSRTTILNSAIANSAKAGYETTIQNNEFILDIRNISRLDKAHILYKHLFFSQIPDEYMENILEEKNYLKIIQHQNYNPGIIQFIFNESNINIPQDGKFMDFALESLNNPVNIWNQVLEKQSNDYVNILVFLLVFYSGFIDEKTFRELYNKSVKTQGLQLGLGTDFDSVVKIAIKNFIKREKIAKNIFYSLNNPSIADFVLNRFIAIPDVWIQYISVITTTKSLQQLEDVRSGFGMKGKAMDNDVFVEILTELMKKGFIPNKDDYNVFLSKLVLEYLSYGDIFQVIFDKIRAILYSDTYISSQSIRTIMEIITDFSDTFDIRDIIENSNLKNYLYDIEWQENDFDLLKNFLDLEEDISSDLLNILNDKISNFLQEYCKERAENYEFNEYEYEYNEGEGYVLDEEMVVNVIVDEIGDGFLRRYWFAEMADLDDLKIVITSELQKHFDDFVSSMDVSDDFDLESFKMNNSHIDPSATEEEIIHSIFIK